MYEGSVSLICAWNSDRQLYSLTLGSHSFVEALRLDVGHAFTLTKTPI